VKSTNQWAISQQGSKTMKHTSIISACLPIVFSLIFAGCNEGSSGNDDKTPADVIDGGEDSDETPGADTTASVFDVDAYTALPASGNLAGLWMAVYVNERAEGKLVNGALDVVRRVHLVRRELVSITDDPQGSTITYCGEQSKALQIVNVTVSHDPIYSRGYGNQRTTLHIEENGTLRMTTDSGIIDAGNDSLIQYYSVLQSTQDLTLIRIANEVPADANIGTLQMSWSQSWPDAGAGSSTEAVKCFAEQREIVAVPGVIENELERNLFGNEYGRNVLYVNGVDNEWAFSQRVTTAGRAVLQESARQLKMPHYPSSIWWTGDELIDVFAYSDTCLSWQLCPPVTLSMNELPQATADEIDDFTNAPTPLFVRQPHTSTHDAITLTTSIYDSNGNYLDSNANLQW